MQNSLFSRQPKTTYKKMRDPFFLYVKTKSIYKKGAKSIHQPPKGTTKRERERAKNNTHPHLDPSQSIKLKRDIGPSIGEIGIEELRGLRNYSRK